MKPNEKTYLEVLGQHLKERRKSKGISINSIPLAFAQVKSIEEGTANYTIVAFIRYLSAIDCYHFVADKDKPNL